MAEPIQIEHQGKTLIFSVRTNGIYLFRDQSGRVYELTEAEVRAYPQMEPIIQGKD